MLYGVVPTRLGPLEVAVPFSAKDTLAPQFALTLKVRAPVALALTRDAFGSWGSGDWVLLSSHEKAETHALARKLKSVRAGLSIEWNSQLAGRYHMNIDWAMQVVPAPEGTTRVLVQNGVSGSMLRSFGVKTVMKSLEAAQHALASPEIIALPAAIPVRGRAMIDSVRERVAAGVQPIETGSASAAFGGAQANGSGIAGQGFNGDLAERDSVRSRATFSLLLGLASVPMMLCVPLAPVAAWLGWSSRKKALALGLPTPKMAIAGIALACVSWLFILGAVGIALVVPKQTSAQAALRQRAQSDLEQADDDADNDVKGEPAHGLSRVDAEPAAPKAHNVALDTHAKPSTKAAASKKPRAQTH